MGERFIQSLKVDRGFVPSQPVAGEANDTIYAGKNIVFRGSPGNIHAETFRGSKPVTSYDSPGSNIFIPGPYQYALAGATFTTGSDEITFAAGTAIPQVGTTIIVDVELYLIVNIFSSTKAKITPAYQGTTGTRTIVTPVTLCAMNDMLGVIHGGGNAISLPQGHIMATGIMGAMYVISNPAPLGISRVVRIPPVISTPFSHFEPMPEGPSLTRRLEDGTYEHPRTLGFGVPPVPLLSAVTGGNKNMPAGRYSIRICRSSLATVGYGNPSEAVEVTITQGQRISVIFPAAEMNQTGWRVFCSLYSVSEGITGPWYEMEEVPEAVLLAAVPPRVRTFEWRDYEIAGSQTVTFDNNIPPNARFVVMFGGMPVLVSCYGPASVPAFTGTSEVQTLTIGGTPTGGTFTLTFEGATTTPITWFSNDGTLITVINSALQNLPNIGAGGATAAAETLSGGIGTISITFTNKRDVGLITATSSLTGTAPTLTIVQTTAGVPAPPTTTAAPGPSVQPGKPYNIEGFPPATSLAMGPVQNLISFVEGEGRLYLATNNYIHILSLTGNPDQPLTVRPYVQTAVVRHNSLVYVEGTLYGYSARGPMRVSGEGAGLEDRMFAAPVRAVTERWEPARVFVVYDPHNESVLWVHSNDSKNDAGWYRTAVLSYSLTLGIWSTVLYIERATQHVIVTGVATLGSRAFFLVGHPTGVLYMWDAANTEIIEWQMATPFIDQPGPAGSKKNIRHVTVTHRGNNSDLDIIGMTAGGVEPSPFDPPDLRVALDGDPALIKTSKIGKTNVRNLRLYLVKVSGVNNPSDPLPNRVDEIILDGTVHGPVT